MKRLVLTALIGTLFAVPAAMAMVGGPLFTIGKQITSMTVEANQVEMEVPISASSSTTEAMLSRRLFLVGRYGLENNVDMDVRLGTADMTYSELGGGYSEYSSSPSLAWGAGLRAGFPSGTPYQISMSLSYVGYHADATTTSGSKSINSKYLWQEVTPTVTAGYAIQNLVPYVGVQKPYVFGNREYTVAFNGQTVAAASGDENFSDSEQELRGLLGLEYRMPDGYSIAGEVATTSSGTWTLAIGLAQALK